MYINYLKTELIRLKATDEYGQMNDSMTGDAVIYYLAMLF